MKNGYKVIQSAPVGFPTFIFVKFVDVIMEYQVGKIIKLLNHRIRPEMSQKLEFQLRHKTYLDKTYLEY